MVTAQESIAAGRELGNVLRAQLRAREEYKRQKKLARDEEIRRKILRRQGYKLAEGPNGELVVARTEKELNDRISFLRAQQEQARASGPTPAVSNPPKASDTVLPKPRGPGRFSSMYGPTRENAALLSSSGAPRRTDVSYLSEGPAAYIYGVQRFNQQQGTTPANGVELALGGNRPPAVPPARQVTKPATSRAMVEQYQGPATKKEQLQRKFAVLQVEKQRFNRSFYDSFFKGFTIQPSNTADVVSGAAPGYQGPGERLGTALGTTYGVLGSAASIYYGRGLTRAAAQTYGAGVSKIASKAAPYVPKALKTTSDVFNRYYLGRQALGLVKYAPVAIGGTLASKKVATSVSYLGATPELQAQIKSQTFKGGKGSQGAVSLAYQLQEQYIGGDIPIPFTEKTISPKKQFFNWFPSAGLFFPKERERAAKEAAIRLNVPPGEQAAFSAGISRQLKAIEYSAIPSALFVEAGSELFGRKNILREFDQKAFTYIPEKKIGFTLAKTGFKNAFFPGVLEASTASVAENILREEPIDYRRAIYAAPVGGVIAGGFQSAILGTAIKSPKLSKGINLGANILDIAEYPGDIFASAIEKGYSRAVKVPRKFPIITEVPAVKGFSVGVEVENYPKTKVLNVNKPGKRSIFTAALNNQNFQRVRKPNPNFNPFNLNIGTPLDLYSPVPIRPNNKLPFTNINENTKTELPINPINEIPTEEPIREFSEKQKQDVSTFSQTFNTNINIPTVTALPRILPPFLPGFDFRGFGGTGVRKGKRKVYVAELSAAAGLIGGLGVRPEFILGTRNVKRIYKKSVSKKRKRGKK